MGIFGETSTFQGTVIQARALMATAAMADIPADDLKADLVKNVFVATQLFFDLLRDGDIPEKGVAVIAQGLRAADKIGLDLPEEDTDRIDTLVPIARTAIYRKGGSKRQRNERRAKMLELTGFLDEIVQECPGIRSSLREAQVVFWNAKRITTFAHLRALEEAQDWHRDTAPFPLPRHFGKSFA